MSTEASSPTGPDMLAAAIALHRRGALDQAECLYQQLLAVDPGHADSVHLLGVIAHQRGRYGLAIAMITEAIALSPAVGAYHSNLGSALGEKGYQSEAVACLRYAIQLQPDDPLAHNNLGNALKRAGYFEEAVACFRRALDRSGDAAETLCNLGSALGELEQLDEAAERLRRALALRPTYLEASHNLGTVLRKLGRLEEAIACFRNSVALSEDNPLAHANLAQMLLRCGHMAEGWPEYEWRWRAPHMASAARRFTQPQWRGEAADGRTLLLHAEQGFGDTLQFCRYAPLAAARGFRVILEAPLALTRLLRSLPGISAITHSGQPLPAFDVHCPLLSLPLAFATDLSTIPHATSYLRAQDDLIAAWRQRLASTANTGLRVGLAWAGNPRLHSPTLAAADRRRSLNPARLAPLASLPGVRLFSLQKDGAAAPETLGVTNLMPEIGDFADTAALIANLDLVISVDTAVAHLAAAIGKQVWVLNRFDSCWRWLAGRRDSPWYPTLRLYNQPRPGDWDSVIDEVVQDLESTLKTWRDDAGKQRSA